MQIIWAASFGGHRDAVSQRCGIQNGQVNLILEAIGKLVGLKTAHEMVMTPDYSSQTALFVAAMVRAVCAWSQDFVCQNGHADVVRYLCHESTADANVARDDGATPLLVAANNNHLEVVRLLVEECKADPSLARYDGQQPAPGVLAHSTPLRVAHHNGHFEIVKYLMGR